MHTKLDALLKSCRRRPPPSADGNAAHAGREVVLFCAHWTNSIILVRTQASEMTLGFRTRLIQRHTAGSILVTCRLRCQPALHLDQLLIWFRLDSMHLCGDINLGPAYRVVQKV